MTPAHAFEERSTVDPSVAPRLQPVRRALLADAEETAASIVDEANDAADRLVTDAEAVVAREIDAARRRAERSMQAQVEADLARARVAARSQVLEAQRRIHDDVVGAVHAAAREMRSDPRYPALVDHLERVAREQLGRGATIDRDSEAGGVVAVADRRRVDYTLPALADRAVAALADEEAQLWS